MERKEDSNEILEDVINKMVKSGEFKNIYDIQEKLKKSFGKVLHLCEAGMMQRLTLKAII